MSEEHSPMTEVMAEEIQQMPLTSLDIKEDQLSKLKEIFPEVFNEKKVDWEKLQLTLGEAIDTGDERFGMSWPGKSECFKVIQQPSVGTLKPCKEESVNWDSTENLFIEGDNLEVLKLLQQAYYGKIKMIYIDPPYNTGKEFIYPDNYTENLQTYLAYSGQLDEKGYKFSTNVDTDGRYHSKWMNMMYPRLFLARNLLKDDGFIFISIDEVELANLKLLCNELFGEENHIADFIWKNKKGGGNDSKFVAVEHEYIVMYAKNEVNLHELFEPYKPEYLNRYKEEDNISKFYWDTFKRKSGKQYYPIICPDGKVLEFDELGNKISWLRSKKRFLEDLEQEEVRFVQIQSGWSVQFKQRLPQGKKPRSIFLEESIWEQMGTTSNGGDEILELFSKEVFSNPKPTSLLTHMLDFSDTKDDIILDFFAGSGTTHHAVLKKNIKDGWNTKIISVQLPEKLSDKTEAEKNAKLLGFSSISEISIERIRRVINRLKTKENDCTVDFGLKILKLSTSNFKLWDSQATEAEGLEKQLETGIDLIKPGVTDEDVLYEILLKAGYPLTTKIETLTLADKIVYSIDGDTLLICLDRQLTKEVIIEMAKREPQRVVCLDNGFINNDQLKTNAVQIMNSHQVKKFQTV